MKPVSALYTPKEMPEDEFRSRFSIRIETLESLVKEALSVGRNQTPRHAIVQGQRGQGKSSLLRMTYLQVRDNQETKDWLVPLLFNEELYSVGRLYKLWEHVAELLSCEHSKFEDLPDKFEAAQDDPHYEKDCYQILDNALREHDICLLLLIDNIGELLEKFKKQEQQRLREILSSTKRLRIIGASTVMLEQHFDQSAPFYQFFRMISLKGLGTQETRTLLQTLGTEQQQAKLEDILQNNPGRVESLRRLTSGVPRTILLLFDILVSDNGDALHDLEILLDRVTPLYKHRMDDLPTQQQEIVDAVALAWDAIGVKEIAKSCRLPSSQVSAQLKQLIKSHIIHQEPTSTKNHLYRLEERFFNIWYLMRNGRARDRRRTLWLVRFLQTWCNNEELAERAERHLQAIKAGRIKPHHARLLTEALAHAGLDYELEDRLIKETRSVLPKEEQDQLPESRRELSTRADKAYETGDYKTAEQCCLGLIEAGNAVAMYNLAYLYHSKLKRYKDAETYYIKAAKEGYAPAMNNLAILYRTELDQKEDAERYFLMAVENNHTDSMRNLALFYEKQFNDYDKAKIYYLMAVEKGHTNAMFNLARLYERQFKQYQEAERYYLMAVEKGHANAMFNLALLYQTQYNRHEEAERYYLMAAEKGHANAMFNLALLYEEQYQNYGDAERYYLMAIEKGDTAAMLNLALIYEEQYQRYNDAERYYKMAIEKGDTDAGFNLALLYFEQAKNIDSAINVSSSVVENIDFSEDPRPHLHHIRILLWSQQYHEAFSLLEKLLSKINLDESKEIFSDTLIFLTAAGQTNYALKLFEEDGYANLSLRDRFKPIYYALLHSAGISRADEFKRMGPELLETVEEILDYSQLLKKKYFPESGS